MLISTIYFRPFFTNLNTSEKQKRTILMQREIQYSLSQFVIPSHFVLIRILLGRTKYMKTRFKDCVLPNDSRLVKSSANSLDI